jgi:hypothetical protein
MWHYKIEFNEDQFIHDKQYREGKIKYVDDNNYREKYDSPMRKRNELENLRDFDEEQIQDEIRLQLRRSKWAMIVITSVKVIMLETTPSQFCTRKYPQL